MSIAQSATKASLIRPLAIPLAFDKVNTRWATSSPRQIGRPIPKSNLHTLTCLRKASKWTGLSLSWSSSRSAGARSVEVSEDDPLLDMSN